MELVYKKGVFFNTLNRGSMQNISKYASSHVIKTYNVISFCRILSKVEYM